VRRLRRIKPTPSLVISSIALFASLGGVSYGLATGSIDSREIKNNTVSTKDIRNNSVRSKDVRNGTLLKRDFKAGQLPTGPAGAAGPPGSPGRPGTNGFGRLSYESGSALRSRQTLAGGESTEGFVPCPAGTFPTGGDVWAFDDTDALVPEDTFLVASFFDTDPDTGRPDGWFASLDNENVGEITVVVEAICANANVVTGPTASASARRRVR